MNSVKNIIFSTLIAAFSIFPSFSFDSPKEMQAWRDNFNSELAAARAHDIEMLEKKLASDATVQKSLPNSAVNYGDASKVWNLLKTFARGKIIFYTGDEADQVLINVAKALNIKQIGIPSGANTRIINVND